jgi:hypothetical protein
MSEVRPTSVLELDPGRIARIIDTAVVSSSELVNFHFNALAGADLTRPAHLPEAYFKFVGPDLSADQRRALHESWMLAKAFQDLLRAVRHALEVAHVLTVLLGKTHKLKSSMTVADFLRPFEARAASLRFPVLLSDVNEKLATKLDFAASYATLQLVRNCLEHRAGIVGKPETQSKEDLQLDIPRMKLFYVRDGAEIEIAKGHVVDPGAAGGSEVKIMSKIETRKRTMALGERITFTLSEFNEIAFACHYLGVQLVMKMSNPEPYAPDCKPQPSWRSNALSAPMNGGSAAMILATAVSTAATPNRNNTSRIARPPGTCRLFAPRGYLMGLLRPLRANYFASIGRSLAVSTVHVRPRP